MSEDGSPRPKPMVSIGDWPLLWHIMKYFSAQGLHDFVICSGLKGELIKDFFIRYPYATSDLRCDLASNQIEVLQDRTEPWIVTIVDTGVHTATAGRVQRVREHLEGAFLLAYGDCLTDVRIADFLGCHRREQTLVTLLAVRPPARFGALQVDPSGKRTIRLQGRGKAKGSWSGGGMFMVEPAALDRIESDDEFWEDQPMARLAAEANVAIYPHDGFWRCVDHLSDKMFLERLWESGAAPWKLWADRTSHEGVTS